MQMSMAKQVGKSWMRSLMQGPVSGDNEVSERKWWAAAESEGKPAGSKC